MSEEEELENRIAELEIMLRPIHYRLDTSIGEGRVPIPCESLVQWVEWFADYDRRVGQHMVGSILLSTVFIGLDHQFGGGPPVLFETMAFDQSDIETIQLGESVIQCTATVNHIYQRYSTWESAELGHREWLIKLRESIDTKPAES